MMAEAGFESALFWQLGPFGRKPTKEKKMLILPVT